MIIRVIVIVIAVIQVDDIRITHIDMI